MKNLFDLFRDTKAADDQKQTRGDQQWRDRESALAQVLRESQPVFAEYQKELAKRGMAAKLQNLGTTAVELRVPLKWTIGVIKLNGDRLTVHVESDPGKSNGYAMDDFTGLAQPPSLPDQWKGPETLRQFMDRALEILIKRFDKGIEQSAVVGP
jgi:hypothetical protein